MKVDSGSLRGLAIWLGAPLPDNGGLGAVSLKTDVRTGPTSVSLSNTELRLDDSTANGTVSVEIVGGRPYVKANLKVNSLDLNRYLGGPGATNSDAGSAAQPAGSASIEDLLRQSEAPRAGRSASPRDVAPPRGPQVKGSVQRSGWSEDPINLAALGLLDGEARVSLGGHLYKDVKIGASQLSLALKSRALRVTLDDMRLYDGQGRGTLTIDTTPAGPTVGAIFNLDGVSGLPLLKDAAGFEWIAGKAKLSLALGGQGANERAIVESLNGRADLAFTDGAIVGLNIQHLIRGLGQGKIGGLGQTPGDKTEFSEAGATYQIKAGIADSRDIRLVSPQLRVAGAGTVDLGHRQIDTTLRSKLVGGQPGLGGVDLSAIEIPIRVKGSWERPQIGPDMDAVMRDPNKAIEAVNAVAKQLGGKDIGQVLRGLMKRGAPGDQPVDPATGQPGSQAGGKGGNGGLQLLEQLLKK